MSTCPIWLTWNLRDLKTLASLPRPVLVCAQAMAAVDRQCLLQGHPEYLEVVRPESLRQRTAVGLMQDLRFFSCPWPFSPGSISPALQRHIQIWHGTNDQQVCRLLQLLDGSELSKYLVRGLLLVLLVYSSCSVQLVHEC